MWSFHCNSPKVGSWSQLSFFHLRLLNWEKPLITNCKSESRILALSSQSVPPSVRHISQLWHPTFSLESPDSPESPDQLNAEFTQFIMSCSIIPHTFPKNKIFDWFFLHTKWQRNVQYIFIKMYHFPLKCTNCPFKCTSFTLKWTNVTKIYNFLTEMFDVLPRILNFYPWNI